MCRYNDNQTCWYRSADVETTQRWLIGTQTFWILFVSAGEVLAFGTIVGYLIAYEVRLCSFPLTVADRKAAQLFTRRFRTNNIVTSSSETAESTILMFRELYTVAQFIENFIFGVGSLHEVCPLSVKPRCITFEMASNSVCRIYGPSPVDFCAFGFAHSLPATLPIRDPSPPLSPP